MFEDPDPELVPWCYPESNLRSFYVPRVGEEVVITFPYQDKYMPVYSGKWENERSHNIFTDENYPDSMGFMLDEETGAWARYDMKLKTFEFVHGTGAFVYIDAQGSVYIQSKQDIGLHAPGKMYIGGDEGVFIESDRGNLGIASGQNISVQGTMNIDMKTSLNITFDSAGINSTQAAVVMHNCGFFSIVANFIAVLVKTMGTVIKSSMTGIGKKFEIVRKTSIAKKEKMDNLK